MSTHFSKRPSLRKLLPACALAAIVTGCAAPYFVAVDSPLTLGQYNARESDFIPQPTRVELSEKRHVLRLSMQLSHFDDYGYREYILDFKRDELEKYLNVMQQFQAWTPAANLRGDSFRKDMDVIPMYGGRDILAKFSFVGSRNLSHYLEIVHCDRDECLQTVYLDREAVQHMLDLLNNWAQQ